jgi:hypothetical protein
VILVLYLATLSLDPRKVIATIRRRGRLFPSEA